MTYYGHEDNYAEDGDWELPQLRDPNVHEYLIQIDPRIVTTNNTNAQFPFGPFVTTSDGTVYDPNKSPMLYNFYAQYPRTIRLTIHGDVTRDTIMMLYNSGMFPGMTPDEIAQALEENGETHTDAPRQEQDNRSALTDDELERLRFLRWQIEEGKIDEFADTSL